jgi:hypothetical protein
MGERSKEGYQIYQHPQGHRLLVKRTPMAGPGKEVDWRHISAKGDTQNGTTFAKLSDLLNNFHKPIAVEAEADPETDYGSYGIQLSNVENKEHCSQCGTVHAPEDPCLGSKTHDTSSADLAAVRDTTGRLGASDEYAKSIQKKNIEAKGKTPFQSAYESVERNEKGKTHPEHSKTVRKSVPCSAGHMNFGGECMNCGWKPVQKKSKDVWNKDIQDYLPNVSEY